jgi:hypothetical protein
MGKGFALFCFGILKGRHHLSDLDIDGMVMLQGVWGRTDENYFSTL